MTLQSEPARIAVGALPGSAFGNMDFEQESAFLLLEREMLLHCDKKNTLENLDTRVFGRNYACSSGEMHFSLTDDDWWFTEYSSESTTVAPAPPGSVVAFCKAGCVGAVAEAVQGEPGRHTAGSGVAALPLPRRDAA